MHDAHVHKNACTINYFFACSTSNRSACCMDYGRFMIKMMIVLAAKLAQSVRHSLMVREVASLIASRAVFAHVNIELA